MTAVAAETDGLDAYLSPTFYLDSDDPGIRAFAAAAVGDATDPTDKAVRLYYAVRDQIVYDPYSIEMKPEAFRASDCLDRKSVV